MTANPLHPLIVLGEQLCMAELLTCLPALDIGGLDKSRVHLSHSVVVLRDHGSMLPLKINDLCDPRINRFHGVLVLGDHGSMLPLNINSLGEPCIDRFHRALVLDNHGRVLPLYLNRLAQDSADLIKVAHAQIGRSYCGPHCAQ